MDYSNNPSFSITEWTAVKKAGNAIKRSVGEKITLHAGDAVRSISFEGYVPAFADAIILGFNSQGLARLSRPFVYASCVGTTGPGSLLGTEEYDISVEHILANFDIIENDGSRKTR